MDSYDAGYLYECRLINDIDKSKLSFSLMEKIDEPIRAVSVMQSDLTHNEDIPLSCMIFE